MTIETSRRHPFSNATHRYIRVVVWWIYLLRFVCRADWNGGSGFGSRAGIHNSAGYKLAEHRLWMFGLFDVSRDDSRSTGVAASNSLDGIRHADVDWWLSDRIDLASPDHGQNDKNRRRFNHRPSPLLRSAPDLPMVEHVSMDGGVDLAVSCRSSVARRK